MPTQESTAPDTDPADVLAAAIEAAGFSVYYGHDGDVLAGVTELARHFGVGNTAVSQWHARRARNGFPEPACTTLGGRDLWFLSEVRAWRESYTPDLGRHGADAPRIAGR